MDDLRSTHLFTHALQCQSTSGNVYNSSPSSNPWVEIVHGSAQCYDCMSGKFAGDILADRKQQPRNKLQIGD